MCIGFLSALGRSISRCRLASSSCVRARGLWLSLPLSSPLPALDFWRMFQLQDQRWDSDRGSSAPRWADRQVLGAWCPDCMGPGSCGHSVPTVPRPSPACKRGAVSPAPGSCFGGNFWSHYPPGVGPRLPVGAQAWVLQVVCVLGPSLAHGATPTAVCVSSRLPHSLSRIPPAALHSGQS